MEHVRNGLYALAVAMVAATIIFSWSITSAATTLGEGLAKSGVGNQVVAVAPTAVPPAQLAAPSQPTAQPPAPQPGGKIELKGAGTKGSDGAKIALVEYSDYQCPFCERFFSQSEGQIIKDYVDTGKVKLLYKNFPLDSIHPNARPAAIAAECVNKIDATKFWAYHDKLFQNYQSLGDENYKKWAGEVGVDATAFNTCYSGRETEAVVDAHFSEGSQNGIQGTPGFKITDAEGKVLSEISGAQPYAAFKAALDSALAG